MEALARRLEKERREDRLRCGSLTSGILMAIALPLAICGLSMPWWVGSGASALVGEENGVDGIVSLWDLEVTTSVLDVNAGAFVQSTYSATWDTLCAEGQVDGLKCHTIRMIRFLIFGTVGALAASLLAAMATYGCFLSGPSLLCLLATAFASLLAGGAAGVALVFATGLGVDGLLGVGVACHVGALCTGLSGCSAAIYAAAKSSPEEEPPLDARAARKKKRKEKLDGPRMERFREARQKAEEMREQLEAFQRRRTAAGAAARAAAATQKPSRATMQRGSIGSMESEEDAVEKGQQRRVDAVEDLIFWADRYGIDHDFPTELLEAAFQQVDADASGRIDSGELLICLRLSGLKATQEAVDQVFSEMDTNHTGDVDIHEFVGFFQLIQEMQRNQRKLEAKGQIQSWVCRLCLLAHIAGLATVFVMLFRLQDDPEQQIQRDFLADTGNFLFLTFFVLFTFVIVLPMIRLTLGPSLKAWALECRAAMPARPSWCRCRRARPDVPQPIDDPEQGAQAETSPEAERTMYPSETGLRELGDAQSNRGARTSISYSETSGNLLPDMPSSLTAGMLSPPRSSRLSTTNLEKHDRERSLRAPVQQPGQVTEDLEVKDFMDPIHEAEEERLTELRPWSPMLDLERVTTRDLERMVLQNQAKSSGIDVAAETGSPDIMQNEVTLRTLPALAEGAHESPRSPAQRSSRAFSMLGRLSMRSRQKAEAERPEGCYDPRAFREAALAASSSPTPSCFSVMHVPGSVIPASAVAKTGCQPVRG